MAARMYKPKLYEKVYMMAEPSASLLLCCIGLLQIVCKNQ